MPFLCLHAVVIKSLQVFSVFLDESFSFFGAVVSMSKARARFVHPFLYSLILSFTFLSLQWIISRSPELVPSDVPNNGRSDFTVNESQNSADLFSTISGAFSDVI